MPQDNLTIRPFDRARELAVAECFLYQPSLMLGTSYIQGNVDNSIRDYDSLRKMQTRANFAKIEFKRKHNIQ